MSDINLRVKVEGKEQLEALWQKFEQGEATLKDVTQIKKEMNAAFKGEIIGTAEYNKFAGQLATINDLQRDVRIQTRAGHEAYFKAGLEVRQLALSSGILKGALGGVTSELANSVLNAVQLKRALVPLGISMTGVGVGIAAVVAILPALIGLFGKSGAAAEAASQKFKTTADRLKSLVPTREDIVALAEAAYLKKDISADERGQIIRESRIFQIKREKNESKEANDERRKTLKLLDDEIKLREAMGSAEDAKARGRSLSQKAKTGEFRKEAIAKAVSGMDEEKKEVLDFSNFAQQTLGNAFSGVFQKAGADLRQFLGVEGHSVIQLLISDVAQLALKFAETAAIAQMLSFILGASGGGFLNILGGLTGISFAKGGAGGGGVQQSINNATMSRAGGSAGLGNLQLRTEIAGTKLAVIVEAGNRINVGRRQ